MPSARLDQRIKRILRDMESFEAGASVANTGTGARREGEQFEHLIKSLWISFRDVARKAGAGCDVVRGPGTRHYARLTRENRSLFVPTSHHDGAPRPGQRSRWLETRFNVSDLVAAFPGEAEAVRKYAPVSGPYSGQQYPRIYDRLSTTFDDTVVLVENDVLHEKLLLEYKTAKSSSKRQLDGNAHERLSFQIMQYLEVATRYTRCSLVVLANGAFVRYRNKYHVNFHVQADRLSNFCWFSMEYACTVPEYEKFLEGLLAWLLDGVPRYREQST